jgi:cytoskeletal protein RodZ
MPTFGDELRRERELRQISLREISEATKISLRYLEALETNEFEHLPGGVFNRGFVRAYSQFIGIDPEAMVNAYLMEEQARSRHGKQHDRHLLRRSQTGAHETGGEASEPRPWLRWSLWILAGAALVVGIYFAVQVALAADAPRDAAPSALPASPPGDARSRGDE